MQDLDEAVRTYLAWTSILDEQELLDLSPHQVRQAQTQQAAATSTVTARLPETYQWLLVPTQNTPQEGVGWQAIRLAGQEALAVRASKKLRNDELLLTSLGATRLRLEMDRVPLWRGDHVTITQLVDDFGRYGYLPRLKDAAVLLEAVRTGCALLTWEQDAFAYAESYDEAAQRYRALRGGQHIAITDGTPDYWCVLTSRVDKSTQRSHPSLLEGNTEGHTAGAEATAAPSLLLHRPDPGAFTARSRSIRRVPGGMPAKSRTRSSRTLWGSSGPRCG